MTARAAAQEQGAEKEFVRGPRDGQPFSISLFCLPHIYIDRQINFRNAFTIRFDISVVRVGS